MNDLTFLEDIVQKEYPLYKDEILHNPLVEYIRLKTRSVYKDSKSRGSY